MARSAALKKDADTATTTAPAKKAANKAPAKTAGTAVAVRGTTAVGAVGDVREMLRKQAEEMNSRTAPAAGNKIAAGNDKMFKLPDGSKVPELRAVIVDFVTFHAYYERAYDPKNITPPGCFAVGLNPKDMAPVDESPNKQAEDCQVCPMNEFGSNGEGKACKNGRRLALLPLNDTGDDVDAEAEMLILDVSPTAIKGFDGYVQQVSRLHQVPPIGVITTISLDPNADYAKAVFSDPTSYNGVGEAMARQAEAKDMLTAKPDFSGYVPLDQVKGRGASKPAAKAGARR